jgi:hypothetical protein
MFIADFCKQQGPDGSDPIPVRCFQTTAQNKYDARFGVEALGTEMSAGIHVFPDVKQGDPYYVEYQKLIQNMMTYDPGAHAGDRLMAYWISNEGLRLGSGGATVVQGVHAAAR